VGIATHSTALTTEDLAGLLASFNDVTARLQASHEALAREVERLRRELGEANAQVERSRRLAALGEMAAGIAHEIRNPLASIRLYARMLEEDLPGDGAPYQTTVKIARAVRAAEAIVGDVLAFAREYRIAPAPVRTSVLFDQVLDACRSEGIGHDVEIVRLDLEPGACGEFIADAGLLRQALVNIVRNAFEAMEEGRSGCRRLTLDARGARLAGTDGQVRAHVVLTVRDTGPGVTPDVVARMFNPFFTTRRAGTGLGLAIVHRIVDAHAGRVRVRNNSEDGMGAGACVEVVLPALGPEGMLTREES
jgi:signal transduction histidine kinase